MLIHELTNGHCIPFWRWHQGCLDQPHRYVAKTSSTLVGHNRSTLALAFEIERMASFINGRRSPGYVTVYSRRLERSKGWWQQTWTWILVDRWWIPIKLRLVEQSIQKAITTVRKCHNHNHIRRGKAFSFPMNNYVATFTSLSSSMAQYFSIPEHPDSFAIARALGPTCCVAWLFWVGIFFHSVIFLKRRLVFVAVSPTSTCWNLAFISGLTSDLTMRLPKYDDFRGYFTTDFTTSLEQSAHIWKMMKQKK